MNSVAQGGGWAAPEIMWEVGTVTREADVFAFGMVAIEVCPCALPHLVLGVYGWMIRLTSEFCLRFSQGSVLSVNSQPRTLS